MCLASRLISTWVAFAFAALAHAQGKLVEVVEFYNAGLDHYFISSLQADIDALDSGKLAGWGRTGRSFKAYDGPVPGTNPVCRFYIPPAQGNSHFYSASPAECADVLLKFPTFTYESPAVMYAGLPDAATGACAAGFAPVYRLWNQRADSNHRYTTDSGIRAAMIAKGYVAEGYGPDGVAMCAASVSSRFDVHLSPPSALLLPGGARDAYIVVTANVEGVGQVDVSVSSPPAGISVQLSNSTPTVRSTPVAARLRIAVAATAAPTTDPIALNITVTDGAGTTATAMLSIEIAQAGDPVAAKLATMAAVEARSMELGAQGSGPAAFAQAIAAFMATQPQYAATGVDEETSTAWGVFADGMPHMVSANRLPAAGAASLGTRDATPQARATLPGATQARLLQSFGNAQSAAPITDMEKWLRTKGWHVNWGHTAGVGTVRPVAGDGFFYFNTHGGRIPVLDPTVPEGKIYALQTSTLVNAGNLGAYLLEHANLELVPMTFAQDLVDAGVIQIPLLFDTRWGITYRFVQKYMKFEADSVVWINACYSAKNEPMIDAFRKAGAGAYMGWTDLISNGPAFASVRYFVDRMVGANEHAPVETPPQRAFPMDRVLADMAKKGLDYDTGNKSKLEAHVLNAATPAIFAPSIRRAWVFENDQTLHLQGDFTWDQTRTPTVKLGGASLSLIPPWSEQEIIAKLPNPTANGDVVVEIGGVRSNARQLTRWSIPITYNWDPAAHAGLKMQGFGTIGFRADIAGFRTEPGGALKFVTPGGPGTSNSALQLTGSGSYTENGCTTTLGGTATFVGRFDLSNPNVLGAMFRVDGESRTGALSIVFGSTAASTFLLSPSGTCNGEPIPTAAAIGQLDGPAAIPDGQWDGASVGILPAITLRLGPDYEISAGSSPSLAAPGVPSAGMVVYKWPVVDAQTRPRDTPDAGK